MMNDTPKLVSRRDLYTGKGIHTYLHFTNPRFAIEYTKELGTPTIEIVVSQEMIDAYQASHNQTTEIYWHIKGECDNDLPF